MAEQQPKPIKKTGIFSRRRLSVSAFLLGLGSVALSMIIVVNSLVQRREDVEQVFLEKARLEVRMLGTRIDAARNDNEHPLNDTALLRELWGLWTLSAHWNVQKDEHFVVIDNRDNTVILDSAVEPGHQPSSSEPYRPVILAVREELGRGLGAGENGANISFTGPFSPDKGEQQLGSFLTLSKANQNNGHNWLLGVYRSRAGLHAANGTFGSLKSLIGACGAAIVLSLLLIYYTYHVAQRDQLRSEEARARLAAIVQYSRDAIFSENAEGVITSWNRGAEQLFGYAESEAIGRRADEIVPSAQLDEEREIIARLARGEQPGEVALDVVRLCRDGRPVNVSQTISPVRDSRGRNVGISVIAHDITSRRNLEREVLESSGREQQRIGRELHDSLGQELTGVSYLAKSLQKLTTAASPLAETAATITAGIQRALREVRNAVQGLVPVEVDASGFMVALEKLAADTGSRCGIDCRVENADPVKIDDNVLATHLYRIVQEAINNAVKHAQARRIVVRPESHNGTLSVTVQDDGVGITEEATRHGGMGLRIMRYRAGVIDATLDVESRPGQGTSVVCLVKRKTEGVPS